MNRLALLQTMQLPQQTQQLHRQPAMQQPPLLQLPQKKSPHLKSQAVGFLQQKTANQLKKANKQR